MSTTITAAQLAAAGHGTFLGEDLPAWRVAAILAVVACIAWEAFMALTRVVSLRIPFLFLYLARLTTPKELRKLHYKRWKGELWFILGNREKHWVVRSFRGLAFSVPLALGGARLTANAGRERAPRRGLARVLRAVSRSSGKGRVWIGPTFLAILGSFPVGTYLGVDGPAARYASTALISTDVVLRMVLEDRRRDDEDPEHPDS
ncbi:hypothetical protein [Streptomyces misionensis]|uniref:hypothetical protein n=1 Tax=Streptomyces misionensis TaxID=67331 RepID=UPI0033F1DCBE